MKTQNEAGWIPLVLTAIVLCRMNVGAWNDAAFSCSSQNLPTLRTFVATSRHFIMKTTAILLDNLDVVLDGNSKDSGRSSIALDLHRSPSHLYSKINYMPP